VLACAFLLGKLRPEPAAAVAFGRATALVMALTVLVVPMYAPYNQVLFVPAILTLVRDRAVFTAGSRGTSFLYLGGSFALAWQWIASSTLSGAYLLGWRVWAISAWKAPFFATFGLPVFVVALMFLEARAMPFGPRSVEKAVN